MLVCKMYICQIYKKKSRHLKNNQKHPCTWNVLIAAPKSDGVRKNLETSFMALS